MRRHDLMQGPVPSDTQSQPCGGSSRVVGTTNPWRDPREKSTSGDGPSEFQCAAACGA